jgi:signal transduction histidine kinase/CheY-like chemotaxis protein/HPt (histidine-containing phosphotransfer) domain-containing protein
MPMRTKATLLTYLIVFAIVLTVPILIGAVIVTYRFANAERARLETQAEDANQEIVTLIDQEISTRLAMLQALATAPALLEGDIASFDAQARNLAARTGTHFSLLTLTGQALLNTRQRSGTPLPPTSDPDILREVRRSRGVYVSNAFRGSVSGDFHVQVAVPILRGEEVIAILASAFKTAQLVELLLQGLPQGQFYATILDRNGIVAARSRSPEEWIGRRFPLLEEAISGGDRGNISIVTAQGVPVFAHYRRSERSGWVVAAAVEREALTAPLAKSLETLAILAAGLAGLAMLGAGWVGAKLTRAHTSLVTAAEALGKGCVIAAPDTRLHETNLVGTALAAASRSIAVEAGELLRANQALEGRVVSGTHELSAKTALLETTLETMTQGLIVIDRDGRVPVCNSQARRMLDLPQDLLGTCPTVHALVAYRAARVSAADSADQMLRLLNPEPHRGPFLVLRPGPDEAAINEVAIETQTVPLPDGGGFVRTFTDVSAYRRQERLLENARDAAEKANRAKSEFVAMISHEMRTPLNAMIGYSELLLGNAGLNTDARRSAERIQSAGAALLNLVDDILDTGRIDAGIIAVQAEPFSLQEVVDDAMDLVRASAQDKGLQLEAILHSRSDAFFIGDGHRLRQILLNLLNNAIKFTRSGSVTLTVAEGMMRETRRHYRFTVEDTGIGISQHEHGNLFQRFHQLDPSMNRQFGGAGLGLSITKQLVERMGGTIGFQSTFGTGSTFWFELPLEPTAPVKAILSGQALAPARAATILVAEDVVVSQELARELLEAAGHTVDVVTNGAEAVEAVKAGAYDMVLMDLSMPDMDGLEATRLIRASAAASRATPIVACTANVLPEHVNSFSSAGIDAYLRKPLRRKELLATVDRVLTRGEARSERETSPPSPNTVWDFICLLGPQKVTAALDRLTSELEALIVDDPTGTLAGKQLADRAHTVISTARMLDLSELADCCMELETACRNASGIPEGLERLGPVIEAAFTTIARLRRDIKRYAG